ncbi:Dicer-like protein 2 [Aspergillus nanangensis]|uniref:Dicer-like protein 2 n=1 Tax=Aspergillus nanangensis TaxID=2582783 RepID=A0AAD4CJC8_ASPNN|nr:Dicer-like protein 2 [Aspergillus nanangensis]
MSLSTIYDTGAIPGAAETKQLRTREYQLEMLDESLKQNVIVVFTWVLCPTVALCEQHLHTIHNRVPSMWCRSFTSNDGVDHWGEIEIWNNALSGVKIAVSTYQVLYDALLHGFVKMSQLSLLIFDEERINQELGPWAATGYMQESIKYFKSSMRMNAEKTNFSSYEKDCAMETLTKLGKLQDCLPAMQALDIPPACQCLLDALIQEYDESFCGLIFVTQRATVMALKWLIEKHPDTSHLFRCGTFIGMSTIQRSKTELGYLYDNRNQRETLERFREGFLNLIITTDALEEGIDIPACNTVLNFNCPLNLKAFIQRRGRARRGSAKFIMIMEDEKGLKDLRRLEQMEKDLIEKFQNAVRREIPNHETVSDNKIRSSLTFCIDSTGAQLAMQDAVSHLYKFCSKLPTQPYVNNRPLFSCESDKNGRFQAVVRLPSNLDPSLQAFASSKSWSRAKYAREEAALIAYKALFRVGLVNDHLLPTQVSDIMGKDTSSRSHYSIERQLDPWRDVTRQWQLGRQLYSHNLQIIRPGEKVIELYLVLPTELDTTIRVPLFVDYCTTYVANLSPGHASTMDVPLSRQVTNLILRSADLGHSSYKNWDYAFLLVPEIEDTMIREFVKKYSGAASLNDVLRKHIPLSTIGILRNNTKFCRPFVIESWVDGKSCVSHSPQQPYSSVEAKIKPLTRRRNFLQKVRLANEKSKNDCELNIGSENNIKLFSVQEYSVDMLPSVFTQASLLIPSIVYEVGIYLAAQKLRQRLFLHSTTAFQRMDLLSIAIRPLCVEHQSTFRSLAFIGDGIINFLLTRQLFLHHPLWHEGLLSLLKQSIVSDAGLASAVYTSGLGEFLITNQFNGKRWRPSFIPALITPSNEAKMRHVGVATLADMSKALVGAGFLDNGLEQAAICASVMVPKLKSWNTSSLNNGTYSETRPEDVVAPSAIIDMEELLGYEFTDKSLVVEAMTHPSCTGVSKTSSYRRLAFLGSSVLEWVVVSSLHRQDGSLSSKKLQSFKSAFTNNNFLTFIALTSHQIREQKEIHVDDDHKVHISMGIGSVSLRGFLRLHCEAMSTKLSEVVQKLSQEAELIKKELWEQISYPWIRLNALAEVKFLADIIQSLFGAVYIDSQANLACCEALAERLGILPLLKHSISNGLMADHPKDTLQALLSGRKVSYQIDFEEHSGKFRCCALADGTEITTVEGQSNRGIITVQAAEKAILILRKGMANSKNP